MLIRSLAVASLPSVRARAAGATSAGAPTAASVMSALADEVPADVVTLYAGLFALVNTTEYADRLEVRMGLLLLGLALALLYFVATRVSEARKQDTAVSWTSAFAGKALAAMFLLVVSFAIWGLLVMSGKQEPTLNSILVIAGTVWLFIQRQLRKLWDLQ